MKQNKTKWYQEPIVLLVIALPMLAVIFSIVTISVFVDHSPDLVSEDYYRDGKTINQRLDLVNKAREQGIFFEISLSNSNLILSFDSELELPLALKLEFTHATLSELDFKVTATKYKDYYSAILPIDLDKVSKWFVEIYPSDETWKVQGDVKFPLKESLILGL